MKNSVLVEPFLVGRGHELEELYDSLESAAKGESETIFISGEAGSGKTRIVLEFFKAVAQRRDIVTLMGGCLSNTVTPYFPFIEAFKSYFSQQQNETAENQEEIVAWLTGAKRAQRSSKYGDLGPQAWKDLTFVAVTKTLSGIAARGTVILFIEDLHWADSASLALLHCIIRTMKNEKILLLGTFRSDEITKDEEGAVHPLAEELRLMKREGICREIRLSNLDQTRVTEIAENMLGGRINLELAGRLYEESKGNALFVTESLRMLAERGNLYEEGGEWHLSVDTIGIPDRFKEIVLGRLSALKFNHRRILDAASVIGERFDVDLLGAVLVKDSLEVLEALSMIAQSTALLCVEKNFFRFNHAKFREAIYDEIPRPLRIGYHARIAEKLETRIFSSQLPLGDIAYHFAQTENKKKAVKYSLAAGEDFLKKYSNAEAIRHFKYVLNTCGDSIYSYEKTRAQEGLGDALRRVGLFEEATRAFAELSRTAAEDTVRLRAIRKGMWTCLLNRDFKRSLELSVMAEQYSACDPLEYARVVSLKGRTYDFLGDPEKALKYKEEALYVFQNKCALQDVANSLVELSTSYSDKGLFENALAAALCSASIYEDLEDLSSQAYALGRLAWRFHVYGFFQEAIETYAETIKIYERIGGNPAQWYNLISNLRESMGNEEVWSAISNRIRKRPDGANEVGFLLSHLPANILTAYKSHLKSAVIESLKGAKLSEETDSHWIKVSNYASLTKQYAKLGDLGKAEESYTKLLSIFTQKKPSTSADNKILVGKIMASEAAYFAGREQWKEANEHFEEAIELLKNPGAQQQAYRIAERGVRFDFALALAAQGRFQEAYSQARESRKTAEEVTVQKKLSRVNFQTFFTAPREVHIGEDIEAWFYIINAGKKPGRIVKINTSFPSEFNAKIDSCNFDLKARAVKFKQRSILPFKVETLKFKLEANKAGIYNLTPALVYLDESGETRTHTSAPFEINVRPKPVKEVLPGRVSTGFEDLDALLIGGIPEKYGVALTTPLIDPRDMIVERFLETGPKAGQPTFYITIYPAAAKMLAEVYQSDFFLFVCNPLAESMVPNLPNIYKLKGIESLTEIEIVLTKALRTLNPSTDGPRRVCIDLVSDILLQHHAVTTRKWLGNLLQTLKSKGFTVLAVLNPLMHPSEEVQAILGLFEGEISVSEMATPNGVVPTLRIRRMYNQTYSDNDLILDRRILQQ